MSENVNKTENTKKSEMEPYLKDIYETFCVWRSLPAFFKYPPKDKSGVQPTPQQFAESMGVDDPSILELLDIRTMGDFAERYKVSRDTLTDWGKTLKSRDSLNDLRSWAKALSKNVLMALYNTAMRKGFAQEVKLYFQLIEGWEEKTKHEVEHKGIEVIRIRPYQNGSKESSGVGSDRETTTGTRLPDGQ